MRTICAVVLCAVSVVGVGYGLLLEYSEDNTYTEPDSCDRSVWDEGVRIACTEVTHVR